MFGDGFSLDNRGARGRIFRAALRLYAERGSDSITLRDLADEAGMARGTIYNNIPQPDKLFSEIASALSREMIDRVERTMQDMTDPAQRIATGMRLFIRRAHLEQDWGSFLVRFSHTQAVLKNMLQEPPVEDIRHAIQTGRFSASSSLVSSLATMMTGSTLAAMNEVLAGEQAWRVVGGEAAFLFLRAAGMESSEAERLTSTELPELRPVSDEIISYRRKT